MSIHKQFLKTRPICKVTFKTPADLGAQARRAHLVGCFNNWSTSATPMKKLKTGAFSTTVELATEQTYQFRYLLDDGHWTNDPDADGIAITPYGDSSNSVVNV